MKPHAEKFLQKRKFYMVLPVLVLPFLTVIFWTLGGGQGVPAQTTAMDMTGLNLSLPDAYFDKKEIWDKLSLYEAAARDSARFKEARERDPYFDLIAFKSQQELKPQTDTVKKVSKLIDSFRQKERLATDPNEDRVNKKLQELYTEINKSSNDSPVTANQKPATNSADPQFTEDVYRLEQMMEMMQHGGRPDPEMQQIESMLEKILDIQHPERVKERRKEQTVRYPENAFSLEATRASDNITLIPQTQGLEPGSVVPDSMHIPARSVSRQIQNGFYGLEDDGQIQEETGNAVEATVHDTQELLAGATVKMRLLNEVTINGKVIPKDRFIYGTCGINGERLTIEINSIRSDNLLLPVSLSVYDLDGLEGIYIPGAITRDVAKQAGDDALQNIQLMSLDPTIGQQAASVGIETAKGLLSKKAKRIKVTVKAGYKILLMDKG